MHAWIYRKGRELKEDIVTSCVFGPLRFMKPNHAWISCLHMFGLQNDSFAKIEPTSIVIRFWPKFKRNDGCGRYVEPDLHILAKVNGKIVGTILIEVKWESPLGEKQLLDQWKFFSVDGLDRDKLRNSSWHVFLSDQHTGDAEKIEERKQSWGNRLIEISWHDLAENLDKLADSLKTIDEVDVWREDLLLFLLSTKGITPFKGFQLACVSQIEWQFEEYTKPDLLATDSLNWNFKENGVAT